MERGNSGDGHQQKCAEARATRSISAKSPRASFTAAAGVVFFRVGRRARHQTAYTTDGFIRADESCAGGLSELVRLHFLHERDDLFFRSAPQFSDSALLRVSRAGLVSVPRSFRIGGKRAR